jgi:hypothetical protein
LKPTTLGTNSVTFTASGSMAAADVIRIKCKGYN